MIDFQNSFLIIGNFCKDTLIPFLGVCVLFRLYIYLGNKNKAYIRGISFFDKIILSAIDDLKNNTKTTDIINFNKNKEEK